MTETGRGAWHGRILPLVSRILGAQCILTIMGHEVEIRSHLS